jgi:hypothetical protein
VAVVCIENVCATARIGRRPYVEIIKFERSVLKERQMSNLPFNIPALSVSSGLIAIYLAAMKFFGSPGKALGEHHEMVFWVGLGLTTGLTSIIQYKTRNQYDDNGSAGIYMLLGALAAYSMECVGGTGAMCQSSLFLVKYAVLLVCMAVLTGLWFAGEKRRERESSS